MANAFPHLPEMTTTQPTEVLANLERRVFYHGTSKRAARRILREGLKDYSWTAETPMFKSKAKRGIVRYMHGGQYGRGTYVTCNWRTALYFGPVLFRVELQPATRILLLDVPPDAKVIDSLKREFGREILKAPPRKVMPNNKRLTLNEAIQLARYHVSMVDGYWLRGNSKYAVHEKLMFDLRAMLVRYGIHGWGEPTDLGGIVVFATDRLRVTEVVLCVPTLALADEALDPSTCYREYESLDAFAAMTRAAGNRGASNTRAWVAVANEQLRVNRTSAGMP
jgi:hypothetical protein